MSDHPDFLELSLQPEDNLRLANLCGQLGEHLRQIERRLGIEINHRGSHFRLLGEALSIRAGAEVLKGLYEASRDEILSPEAVHLFLQESGIEEQVRAAAGPEAPEVVIRTKRGVIHPRGLNQREYLHKVATHDINFGVGPAGTGKSWLAVAMATQALQRKQIERIVLTRPAVEAGERLG